MHCRTSSRRLLSIHYVFLTSFAFLLAWSSGHHSFFGRSSSAPRMFLARVVVTCFCCHGSLPKRGGTRQKDVTSERGPRGSVQCRPWRLDSAMLSFFLQNTLLTCGARPYLFEHIGKKQCNAAETWSAKLTHESAKLTHESAKLIHESAKLII